MHKFHNQYGFAYPRPAEQAGFAAFHKGAKQVDHFNAGF